MASRMLGIDLGTSMIKICQRGAGIVLDEHNVIATTDKSKVLAIGDEAYDMLEKAPVNIDVSYPIKNGVIADIANMQSLLKHILNRINGKSGKMLGRSIDFVIAVPTDITDVEQRSFIDLIFNANAKVKNISIVKKPIADAVGIGLDVTNAYGVMTVNVGADTTEISIMSLGGIVISKLVSVGGNQLDDSIRLFVKKKYNLVIGNKTAEAIKKGLASAYPNESSTMKVYGRDVVTGLPMEVQIDSPMVYDSIKEYLHTIVDSVKIILERTPPEISADIIDSGIYLTGGSASIKGFGTLIEEETGLTVNVADRPSDSVVLGLCRIMEESSLSSLFVDFKQASNRRYES